MNSPILMPSTFPVTCHTDFVGLGSTFVAIQGYAENGINYIEKAIEKGARTIVVHHDALLSERIYSLVDMYKVVIERVDNTRRTLAQLSTIAAESPAQKLKIIGVTGTKGKTTTSFLLEHIFSYAGFKTALISSVQNKINGTVFPSSLTTPQPDYLQQFLKQCVAHDVEYLIMEVAAQALTLHRVDGIAFNGIIFTNFSHEHLEFYPNLNDYLRAKCLIFDMAQEKAPILINKDNQYGGQLMKHRKMLSFGFNGQRDYKAKLKKDDTKIVLELFTKSNTYQFACKSLFGIYNAYNVLAAASMALALKIEISVISNALQTFLGVPGRLQEHALPNGARCFIDYAHNPESFQAVLSTLRKRTSHLIVVFGAGGARDKSKRPMMGLIAATIADIIIITSDNPRQENPADIAQDIMRDIPSDLLYKCVQELDRKKAIEYAYHFSDEDSVIALLGKGPDEYQIIGTTKHYFSERTILEQL